MEKNKISRYLVLFGICTLLAVLVMIIQKSYSNLIGPIDKVKKTDLTSPINPNLDFETLELIEKRFEPPI